MAAEREFWCQDLVEHSVRDRMLGYFFNRLMHRDLDCFRMPRHNRGLDLAESRVNTSRPITNLLLAGPDYSSRRTLRPADFIVFYVGCRIDQALKVIRVIPGLFNVRACVRHDSFTRVPERKQKKLYLCLFCPTQ